MMQPFNNGDIKLQSSYLKHLPALYRNDEFMGRFLIIFESILEPIERTVDNLSLYFDPLISPHAFFSWLASWVDLTLDPTWPENRRRELVKSATELYRWRGTKRGLREYLRIYTGSVPEITEYIEGMHLSPQTVLGVNTQLGSSGGGYHFTITLDTTEDKDINIDKVKRIIDNQKPAHTVYTLNFKRKQLGKRGR